MSGRDDVDRDLDLDDPPLVPDMVIAAGDAEPERKSQATILADLVIGLAELWSTPAGDGYATIDVDDHREHHPVRSREFKRWAARVYRSSEGRAPSRNVIDDALTVIEGEAIFAGPVHEVSVRVAGDREAIYLDLGDPGWRAVEITATGWRVVASPPVRLVRRPGTRALPEPLRGGSIADLAELHPALTDEQTRALVASWIVGCLRPWASYAMLALIGEHGSGKSWLGRMLSRLVDPTAAELRSPPRDSRDLAAAVRAGRVIALDNVGRIQPWLSDALCIVSTGGTFASRALFTDDSENLVTARQPILMTAIDEVITAGDLRDRALIVRVPPLSDGHRASEVDLAARIESLTPRLLGVVLDAIARGLANNDRVDGAAVHRLADHVRWSIACEVAPADVIERAHRGQRDEAVAEQLADPLGEALADLGREGWSGSMTELLATLEWKVPIESRDRRWPTSPRGMGSALRRLAPALRRSGIDVVEGNGYGPRSRNRGATLRRNVGDVGDIGDGEIAGDPAPTLDAATSATSAQRRQEKPSDSNVADVADVADVAPVTPWCEDCGATVCVCDAGERAGPTCPRCGAAVELRGLCDGCWDARSQEGWS